MRRALFRAAGLLALLLAAMPAGYFGADIVGGQAPPRPRGPPGIRPGPPREPTPTPNVVPPRRPRHAESTRRRAAWADTDTLPYRKAAGDRSKEHCAA